MVRLKIDGVDIRKMKRSDVRQMFGMVLQDTWLFNGTIRQNLMYGIQKLPRRDDETAKEAHVDHLCDRYRAVMIWSWARRLLTFPREKSSC